MTLRIEKPAFNLREKLSEIDYQKVPYEKMPAGSIIQTAHFQTGTEHTYSSTSFTSSHKMKFTPRFASSKLRLHIWASTYMHTGSGNAGHDFQIVRTFGATNSNTGNEDIIQRQSWMNYLNRTPYSADFYPDLSCTTYDLPHTTEQITYDLQGRKYGGSSGNWAWRIGYQTLNNNSDLTYAKGPSFVWTIQEIRG